MKDWLQKRRYQESGYKKDVEIRVVEQQVDNVGHVVTEEIENEVIVKNISNTKKEDVPKVVMLENVEDVIEKDIKPGDQEELEEEDV
eukprot:3299622-Ditylum_brightwellii.AAC.1